MTKLIKIQDAWILLWGLVLPPIWQEGTQTSEEFLFLTNHDKLWVWGEAGLQGDAFVIVVTLKSGETLWHIQLFTSPVSLLHVNESYWKSVQHRTTEGIQDANGASIGANENELPIVTEFQSSPVTDAI